LAQDALRRTSKTDNLLPLAEIGTLTLQNDTTVKIRRLDKNTFNHCEMKSNSIPILENTSNVLMKHSNFTLMQLYRHLLFKNKS